MKLLILPSWYPSEQDPINGSFCKEQAEVLSKSIKVKVLIIRWRKFPKVPKGREGWIAFFSEIGKYLFGNWISKKPSAVKWNNDFECIDLTMTAFGLTKKLKYSNKLSQYEKVFEKLFNKDNHPEILHAHSTLDAGFVAWHINKRFSIPYVITEHRPFEISAFPKYQRKIVREIYQRASLTLSLSTDKIRQLGIAGIEVDENLVYNMIDDEKFNVLAQRYEPGSTIKLLTVGAASFLKDHSTLLRTLRRLKDRAIPFKMTMIGLGVWGSQSCETTSLIDALDLSDEITVIPSISRDKMQVAYSTNNVFMLTSIAEGLSVSVLEAMSCGLYIVATRHGGTEDVVSQKTGTLCNIKDWKALADALESMYLGNIRHEPEIIRSAIVEKCGKAAFSKRQIDFYRLAIKNKN